MTTLHNSRRLASRYPLFRAWLASLVVTWAAALPTPLHAQSPMGSVTGAVIDAATGKFLEGADVSVEGTALHGVTEREGRFTLREVPTGARNIVVTYPGLEAKSMPVTVNPGQTATANV